MRSWKPGDLGCGLTLLSVAIATSCGGTSHTPRQASCSNDDCAGAAGTDRVEPPPGGSAAQGTGGTGEAGETSTDGGEAPQICPSGCGAEQVCVNGACANRACAPGERRCSEANVEQCNATGTDWIVAVNCGPFYHCQVTTEPLCVARACEPGQKLCTGNAVTVCTEDGGVPSDGDDCGEDICFEGACTPKRCEPNAQLCVDGDVHVCMVPGLQSSLLQDCPSDAPCGPYVNGGLACVAPICEPGEGVCLANAFGKCGEDGRSLVTTSQDCASSGLICDAAGACAASSVDLAGQSLEVEAVSGFIAGNVIDVHSARRVTKLEAHLLLDVPRDLRWIIFEWQAGVFVAKVNTITTNNVGSSFFASPPLTLNIAAGKRYIFAVGTVVGDGYLYYDPQPDVRRLSFGTVVDAAFGTSMDVGASTSTSTYALRVTTTTSTP